MDNCKLTGEKCVRCTKGECENRRKAKLTERQKQVIMELCENDMVITETARALYVTVGAVVTQIDLIRTKTGLNPRCFYDLVEFMDFVRGEM